VEADPDLERDAEPVAEVLVQGYELFEYPEARVHRALRVVLVRAREADVGDEAVADVASRVAVEPLDGPHARMLVVAEDLTKILGVERLDQRRGADEIAEQRGHVAPLRGVLGGCGGGHDRTVLEPAAAAAAEPHSGGVVQTAVGAPHVPADLSP
jgi:hypothetical protein